MFKVFKIGSRNSDKIFLGYTKGDYIYPILNKHKRLYNKFKELGEEEYKRRGYRYYTSFEIINSKDVYISLIDTIKDDIFTYINHLKNIYKDIIIPSKPKKKRVDISDLKNRRKTANHKYYIKQKNLIKT